MGVADAKEAEFYLEHIGYYRLSGYTHPFKTGGVGPDKNDFKDGTTFEEVLDRYIFDRKLRLHVMDAVERVEIAIRSALSNSIATRHGPHWYLDPDLFNCDSVDDNGNALFLHGSYITEIKKQIDHRRRGQNSDVFIKHYYDEYDNPEMPPSWMIFESVSFGVISRTFKFLAYSEHKRICDDFGLRHDALSSWVHSISYVRNLCAHHSRLWNRKFTIKPYAAKAYRADLKPNDKIYAQLFVMQILLERIAPENHWALRLAELFDEHPNIPLGSMGFPANWRERNIWRLKEEQDSAGFPLWKKIYRCFFSKLD